MTINGDELLARVERLEHLTARPNGGGSGGNPNAECFDVTQSGSAFPGPPINPADIGPAVQAAANAAAAIGGGVVCIPPRSDGISLFWGWTTQVTINDARTLNFTVKGTQYGAVFVQLQREQGACLVIGNCGEAEVTGLMFFGNMSLPLTWDVSVLIQLQENRLGHVHHCQFWGVRALADQLGVLAINCDSVHVHDVFFAGCDYQGFALPAGQGGVFCMSGVTDFATVENVRWMSGADPFMGVAYQKSGSAKNVWIWVGGQDNPAINPQAYGTIAIKSCLFENLCTTAAIYSQGARAGLVLAVVEDLLVEDCSFNNQISPGIVTNKTNNVNLLRNAWGVAASGSLGAQIGNAQYVNVEDCTSNNGTRLIQWTGPVTYFVSKNNDPAQIVFDDSLNFPSAGRLILNHADEIYFNPKSIPGCVLWLRSDIGVTVAAGLVTRWADQSGAGNDFTGGVGTEPPFNASDPNTNFFPSIGPFNVGGGSFLSWAGTAPTPAPWQIVGVLTVPVGPIGNEFAWGENAGNRSDIYASPANAIHWFSSNGANDLSAPRTVLQLVSGVQDGAGGVDELFANQKTVTASAATGAVQPNAFSATREIGAQGGNTNNWGGVWAEIIVYDHVLTDADQTRVEEYLGSRYRMTVNQ